MIPKVNLEYGCDIGVLFYCTKRLPLSICTHKCSLIFLPPREYIREQKDSWDKHYVLHMRGFT